MESRRITLLRYAYNLGRLKFEYPLPSSRLREEQIINEVEEELVAELLFKRSLVNAAFLSNNHKASEMIYSHLTSSQELTLPYTAKSSKIYNRDAEEFVKKEAKTIKEENDAWIKFLAQKQKDNKK